MFQGILAELEKSSRIYFWSLSKSYHIYWNCIDVLGDLLSPDYISDWSRQVALVTVRMSLTWFWSAFKNVGTDWVGVIYLIC